MTGYQKFDGETLGSRYAATGRPHNREQNTVWNVGPSSWHFRSVCSHLMSLPMWDFRFP